MRRIRCELCGRLKCPGAECWKSMAFLLSGKKSEKKKPKKKRKEVSE